VLLCCFSRDSGAAVSQERKKDLRPLPGVR
jgi:hypothetical protein